MLIRGNRLYLHKVVRINWTSYDMRRQQDSINPRTHPDILMLAPEDSAHPYLYARVLGVFHAYVSRIGPQHSMDEEPQLMQVLWVRWFELDTRRQGGFKARRLHRLEWVPAGSDGAFGFVSPDCVLRATHLIPAFAHGKDGGAALPGYSIARSDSGSNEDWRYHYVSM